MDWVLKASKFCNLRCRYCYEWNQLADRSLMPLDTWARALELLAAYHDRLEQRLGEAVRSNIIWHGGEPMLLPLDYIERVFELQDTVLPRALVDDGSIVNSLQTNLYSLSEAHLALWQARDVGLGVSFDVVPGARLNAGGAPTEDRVLANIETLGARGYPLGIIAVLAGHTAPRVDDVVDFMVGRGLGGRLLPLFAGPDERPLGGLELTPDAINDALFRAFVRWFEAGMPTDIEPLKSLLDIVTMRRVTLDVGPIDLDAVSEHVFIVDTDGALYTQFERYGEESRIGDVTHQDIDAFLASSGYRAMRQKLLGAIEEVCAGCRFRGPCDGAPLAATPDGSLDQRRCLMAAPVCAKIERYLDQHGYFSGPDGLDAALDAAVAEEWSLRVERPGAA